MTSIVKIDLQVLNSGINQSVNELEEVGAKDDGDLPVHFSRSLVAYSRSSGLCSNTKR